MYRVRFSKRKVLFEFLFRDFVLFHIPSRSKYNTYLLKYKARIGSLTHSLTYYLQNDINYEVPPDTLPHHPYTLIKALDLEHLEIAKTKLSPSF